MNPKITKIKMIGNWKLKKLNLQNYLRPNCWPKTNKNLKKKKQIQTSTQSEKTSKPPPELGFAPVAAPNDTDAPPLMIVTFPPPNLENMPLLLSSS